MSEPLKIWFFQFARCSLLFFLLSAITPKMQVRSRAIEHFQRAMREALVNPRFEIWRGSTETLVSVYTTRHSTPLSIVQLVHYWVGTTYAVVHYGQAWERMLFTWRAARQEWRAKLCRFLGLNEQYFCLNHVPPIVAPITTHLSRY